MEDNERMRLTRAFLQALIAADKAETELRCYLMVHQAAAGVSDLNEYESLHAQQQRTAEARHRAYLALANGIGRSEPVRI